MSNRFWLCIILKILCIQIQSQDFHFSQFYASPLTTNPALTGNYKGLTRISSNYRLQWDNVATNSYLYQTPSASVEFNFPEKNIALGLVAVNDQTNNKTFNTLEAGLSFAYKVNFERFQITMGLQGWYCQVYYDWNKLSQTILQTETNLGSRIQKLDMNAGLFATYIYPNKKNTVYYGVSIFHILQPRDQVTFTKTVFFQPIKPVGHIGADFSIRDKLKIIPGLFASYQAKSTQFNFGTTLGYHLSTDDANLPNSTIFLGLWTRWNESKPQAFIPKVGYEFNKIRATFSYDFMINNISSTSTRTNTFELSLNYILQTKERSREFNCYYSPYF